jgi:hypothetical protein
MAAAMARRFLKNRSTREVSEEINVSKSQIVYASVVLEHAPDLADVVLAGSMPLNEAYAKAGERRANAETDQTRMGELGQNAPDLAELVTEERLPLGFTTLNGQEPVVFILSQNIHRRHLSKGQRAMAAAMANRMTTKLSLRESANDVGINRESVRKASVVLEQPSRMKLCYATLRGSGPPVPPALVSPSNGSGRAVCLFAHT